VATRCGESVILDERIESPVRRAPIVQIRSIEVTDAALRRGAIVSQTPSHSAAARLVATRSDIVRDQFLRRTT
jgi:hypothetical protein